MLSASIFLVYGQNGAKKKWFLILKIGGEQKLKQIEEIPMRNYHSIRFYQGVPEATIVWKFKNAFIASKIKTNKKFIKCLKNVRFAAKFSCRVVSDLQTIIFK